MKKILMILGLLSLSSLNAFANDGGMAYIDVKGIDPGPLSAGQEIKFYGQDAAKFWSILPQTTSVMPELAKKHHGVALVSNGWNLFINCANEGGSEPVSCTISAAKVEDPNYKYDLLGDAFAFEKKMVCKK